MPSSLWFVQASVSSAKGEPQAGFAFHFLDSCLLADGIGTCSLCER